MTMELEDRLWVQLEAAAEREARRGRFGRGARGTRSAVQVRRLAPSAALLAVLAAIVVLVSQNPQRPEPHWRVDQHQLAGGDLAAGVNGFGSLWTYDRGAGQVLRVDPRSHRVVARMSVPTTLPSIAIATGAGAVWAVPVQTPHYAVPPTGSPVTMVRIDPRLNRITARILLRAPDRSTLRPAGVIAQPHVVWVWGQGGVQRIDPVTDRVTTPLEVPDGSLKGFVATPTRVSAATELGRLVSFDARTGAREGTIPIPAPFLSQKLVAVGDSVIVEGEQGSIASVDPISGRRRWTARLGSRPRDLTLIGDRLWVLIASGSAGRDQLVALDPRTGRVVAHVALPGVDAQAITSDGSTPMVTTADGHLLVVRRPG